MAAVIRAPSVCVCLWCQPKDLVVPLVAGATIPHSSFKFSFVVVTLLALNRLGLNSLALHVFMDAFQGCYRLEPYDMRYFSAYYIFLRVFISFSLQLYIPYLHSLLQHSASFLTLC